MQRSVFSPKLAGHPAVKPVWVLSMGGFLPKMKLQIYISFNTREITPHNSSGCKLCQGMIAGFSVLAALFETPRAKTHYHGLNYHAFNQFQSNPNKSYKQLFACSLALELKQWTEKMFITVSLYSPAPVYWFHFIFKVFFNVRPLTNTSCHKSLGLFRIGLFMFSTAMNVNWDEVHTPKEAQPGVNMLLLFAFRPQESGLCADTISHIEPQAVGCKSHGAVLH